MICMIAKQLRGLMSQLSSPARPKIDRHWKLPVDELSNAKLQDLLQPIVLEHPALSDFEPVDTLIWAKNLHPPIRPVLAFQRMKGGVLWPVYGLSVDFVPVISGKRAVMRTGTKSVKLDIEIDPRDHGFDIQFQFGADAAARDAEVTLPIVLKQATKFWSDHQTLASLADAVNFEERHTLASPGLGVENYVQASFARPFLLAASGKQTKAEQLWQAGMEVWQLDEIGRRKAQEQFERVLQGYLESS